MAKVHDESMASLTWTSYRCVSSLSYVCMYSWSGNVFLIFCFLWFCVLKVQYNLNCVESVTNANEATVWFPDHLLWIVT